VAVVIPEKSYFKIGEVSRIVGVEPYNIRYWESQFRDVKPTKTKSNQRLYRRKDIEVLLAIKALLYQDGFTIAGAKKKLKSVLDGESSMDPGNSTMDGGMAGEERRAYDDLLSSSQSESIELRREVESLKHELRAQRGRFESQLVHSEKEIIVLKDEAVGATSLGGDLEAVHEDLLRAAEETESLRRELNQLKSQQRLLIQSVRQELTSIVEDVAQVTKS
jgi:DNA-binding transcriptional MerR regulator